MPRIARIDAPAALHHIIIRGIEKKPIFLSDADRDRFVSRLARVLTDTATACYAWALMPNHVHLLLRTGMQPMPPSCAACLPATPLTSTGSTTAMARCSRTAINPSSAKKPLSA